MHMWDKFTSKEGLGKKDGKPVVNFEQFQELILHASPEIKSGSKYVSFLFKIFDQDRDGVVGFREWVNGISIVFFGSIEDKMRQVFRCYNKGGDDCLLESELVEMLEDVYALSGREVGVDPRALAHDMFLNASIDVDGGDVRVGASFDQFYSFVHMEPLVYESLAFDILLMSSDGNPSSRSARRMSVPLQKMILKRVSFIFNTTSLTQPQQFDVDDDDSGSTKGELGALSEIGLKTSSSMTSSGRRSTKRKESQINAPLLQNVNGVSGSSNSSSIDSIDDDDGGDDEITPEPNFTCWDLTIKRILSYFTFCCCCCK